VGAVTGIAIALGAVMLYIALIATIVSIIDDHFNDEDEDD
jgi:hypothetical protein